MREKRKLYHSDYCLKEHFEINNIAKFGCKLLANIENIKVCYDFQAEMGAKISNTVLCSSEVKCGMK